MTLKYLYGLMMSSTLRQELDDVLNLKKGGSGFHYVYHAEQLAKKAHRARQWHQLLKTPINQWKKTLAETHVVLQELRENGIRHNR